MKNLNALLVLMLITITINAQTCLPPIGLTFSNITSSSGDISWTNTNTPADTIWDIEIGLCGFIPTRTPVIAGVNTNTFSLVGLPSAVSLRVYVRSYCTLSNTYSAWVSSDTCFSTLPSPLCLAPSNISFSNITTNSADITWVDNNTPVSSWWELEIGPNGFTPTGIPTHTNATNPFSLNGLTSNTTMCAYVRSMCSSTSGLSPWSATPQCFTTQTPTSTSDVANNTRPNIIFPNPSCGNFSIHKEFSKKLKRIIIVDSRGKKFKDIDYSQTTGTTISFTDISPGLYFCKLLLSNHQYIVEKIIIQ